MSSTQNTTGEESSLYDVLVELIRKARTISEEQKDAMIAQLEKEGLPVTAQKALASLFEQEAALRETLITDKRRQIEDEQQQMEKADRDNTVLERAVVADHDAAFAKIEADFHEEVEAECRNCAKDVEAHKRGKDDDQADAIRNALKRGE